jgi:curved DNA-binding protein CbpA
MTDYFSLFKELRRPWLDAEALKQKFLELSTSVHPDRVHNLSQTERTAAQERYVELNSAYTCLAEPKDRLRHLLELELGVLPKDIQRIPSGLMDLSVEIGQACRQADAFIREKNQATSPLLKVQFFERGQEFSETLGALHQKVKDFSEGAEKELQLMDSQWEQSSTSPQRPELFRRLEEIYRLLSYFARWKQQMQERLVQLSF